MAELKLNRKLNFVVEVETESGASAWVHITPILNETFKAYYAPISRAYLELFTGGGGDIAGPRVAAFVLEEHAKKLGVWDGKDGVRNGLMEEIKRLSNVVMLTDAGWKTMQYADAVSQKLFEPDDFQEVEHALCFFTLVSAMAPRTQQRGHLEFMAQFWSVRPEPLDFTAFAAGLKTSKEEESSGEKATHSSTHSSTGHHQRVSQIPS
jgi:hypothetical protein